MDTKALRQKILDLAIRGKLVPQDPNDEPASMLLERIRAQKQQMVKEGKLKAKDIKNDTIIFKGEDNLHYEKFQDGTVKCIEDEIPFEIPEGWAWCRLGSVVSVFGGKRIPAGRKLTQENTGHIYIRVSDMRDGTVYKDNLQFVPTDIYPKIKQYIIKKEDVYITVAGTIGRIGKIPPELDGVNLTENADRLVFRLIEQDWLIYILQSELLQKKINFFTTQVGQPKLAIANIQKFLIPLPSQKAQSKISTCIQSLEKTLSLIDAEASNIKDSIDAAKSRILDLATRGKLVPQDPSDEPASVLLERIRTEKEELVKQGKIKRDKKESVIFKGEDNSYYEKIGDEVNCIDEEIPFDIPNKWEFVRLGELWHLISGRDLKPDEYNDSGNGIPYITGASNFVGDDKISIARWTTAPQVISEYGDLLITCKGTVGEMAINILGQSHIARQVMAIRNTHHLSTEFLILCLRAYITTIKQAAKGLIPGISREDIINIILPFPPEEHQMKIVLAVKKYEEIVKSIEASLS